MGDVIDFGKAPPDNMPPDRLLKSALDRKLRNVIIIGVEADDSAFFATNIGDYAEIIFLLERVKFDVMEDHNRSAPEEPA